MIQLQVGPEESGSRLDHYLQSHLPQFSRSRLQEWVKSGRVLVNGRTGKPSQVLRGTEAISVEPADPEPLNAFAEDLPVEVLYEDAAVVVVNKPAGMVVHLGAGHRSGTLVNALLHRFGALSAGSAAERPGIVHRLDRETSGALVVARTDAAHRSLARQFAGREVQKTYLALAHRLVRAEQGRINTPIERDPIHRTRMTTKTGHGRAALTEYKVIRRYAAHTYLSVALHTGRTHQIRVHLSSIGHPIVGDRLYGAPADEKLGRFFLHAARLRFVSPATDSAVEVEAPLAKELENYLRGL